MSALAALRPMMQWFLAHTAMSGLVLWSFSSTEVEKWPWKAHLNADAWITASAPVVIGLVFNGVAALMFKWWAGCRGGRTGYRRRRRVAGARRRPLRSRGAPRARS